jgi:hypothetical protein
MITVINKYTGELLFGSAVEVPLADTEIAVTELLTEHFLKPFYNFETKKFYEGATPQEIAELKKESVAQEVQLWRIRTILKSMNLEESIETVLNNLEEPTKTAALCIWNYGTSVERNSQTVALLQTALQLTSEQVDDMFIEANNIQL